MKEQLYTIAKDATSIDPVTQAGLEDGIDQLDEIVADPAELAFASESIAGPGVMIWEISELSSITREPSTPPDISESSSAPAWPVPVSASSVNA